MFNALAKDTYVGGGDISVTRLIAPPRIVTLRRHHEDEIEEDASDRIWSLMGSSVHRMLELSASDDCVVETRLIMPVQGLHLEDGPLTWKVSGQPDVYDKKELSIYDYKVTSVWSLIFGEHADWEAQVNLQAMLHRHKGDKVERGYIVAVLRDWQNSKARHEKNYPPTAVKKIPIPLWPQEQCVAYTQERLKLHQKAQLDYIASGKSSQALPMCSEEERWYRGQKFVVNRMKTKTQTPNKRADRLCETREEAEEYIAKNPKVPTGTSYLPIEERKGVYRRCLEYCDVAMFCEFGRKLKLEEAARAQLQFTEKQEQQELGIEEGE